jgi:aminoglycoside/choline kinase family phosphotransferase
LTPSQVDFLGFHIDGFDPDSWSAEPAGHAGSDRHFIRVSSGDRRFILIIWDSADKDWDRFLAIQRYHKDKLPVLPEIYAADSRHGLILEEDLGNRTLKQAVQSPDGRHTAEDLYREVVRVLISWHHADASHCPTVRDRAMDREMFLWESDYFAAHCITEYFGREDLLDSHWSRERRAIAAEAAQISRTQIHRDFQSENILIARRGICFVDFQGARMGPPEYDLASLLFDPYVDVLGTDAVYRVFDYYRIESGREHAVRSFEIAAIQRLMQALGAFGNLTIHKGKQRYRAFIPVGLSRLAVVLSRNGSFPALSELVNQCIAAI